MNKQKGEDKLSTSRMKAKSLQIIHILKRKKEYYKHLYAHKFGYLDEMDKFLERHQLLKPTQEKNRKANNSTISIK